MKKIIACNANKEKMSIKRSQSFFYNEETGKNERPFFKMKYRPTVLLTLNGMG